MKDIKRIIISRTDKIGDLVLSIPSFFMVKKMYPNAEIIVLVRKYNYEIVKNLPYIDRVVKIDDYRKVELIEKIKYFKADVFIALYNDEFVMQLAKASGARVKIGPLSKIKSFFIYNKGVLQKRSKSIKNEAEYNLDLVKKLDYKKFDDLIELNTEIYYEEKHRKSVEVFIAENEMKSPILVINPFMGGSAKNISDKEYMELIKSVLDKIANINVVLTCHISEEDRGQLILDGTGSERVYLYANGGDLLNLAAMIDKADVYFGGSTGPTHIAGSLKKSIVAIYPNKKTQSPLRWGVFGHEDVTYIVPDKDKKEDYKHKFFDSYTDETREEIVGEILAKLKRSFGSKNNKLIVKKKRSLREKTSNSLKKRLEKLMIRFNLFLFFPKKFNEFQKYDNLRLYIDSEELFLNNIDVLNGKYLKYDVILTYIGIKGIEEKNDKYLKIIEKIIDQKELEKKIKEKNDEQPLLISKDEMMLKGEVFKLSMALYKRKKRISVKYNFQEKKEVNYDFNWLKNNFNQNDIEIILKEYDNLRKRFYPQTNMLIWAPAHKYLKIIKKEVSKKSYITKEFILEFDSKDELKCFLEEVYCRGNHIFGRVQQKWDRIKDEELKVIVLWVETNISKTEKGFLIEMVELKKRIRKRIRKKMKNYVFDSIIHMGGNIGEIEELDEILNHYIKKKVETTNGN